MLRLPIKVFKNFLLFYGFRDKDEHTYVAYGQNTHKTCNGLSTPRTSLGQQTQGCGDKSLIARPLKR